MDNPIWRSGPPRRILLATDLSARCDRALDRAASLARQWQSELVVLHVLEEDETSILDDGGRLPSWRRPADPAMFVRAQILADLGAVAEKASMIIDRGDPAEAILRCAEAEGCDLVVVAVARDELLGRFSLGRTVDQLLRRSEVPLLVVRQRARAPYGHIVVATDFSEPSRQAFEAAVSAFPEHRLTLLHAYDVPIAGLMTDSAPYQEEHRRAAAAECEAFLKRTSRASSAQWPDILIEQGAPDSLLETYVRDNGADLAVVGTRGRGALVEAFLGSVAKRILASVPCDALVVRAAKSAAAS